MKIQKDMIVGIDSKCKMPKYLQHFYFICLHDADDNQYSEVEVEVFCHKAFSRKFGTSGVTRFKKNILKGIKYKFKTHILV